MDNSNVLLTYNKVEAHSSNYSSNFVHMHIIPIFQGIYVNLEYCICTIFFTKVCIATLHFYPKIVKMICIYIK